METQKQPRYATSLVDVAKEDKEIEFTHIIVTEEEESRACASRTAENYEKVVHLGVNDNNEDVFVAYLKDNPGPYIYLGKLNSGRY